MTLNEFIASLPRDVDFDRSLACIPYAIFLGLRLRRVSGSLVTVMRFSEDLIGSPMPPAIHGGTIGALLEIAGVIQTASAMSAVHLPKTIDLSIDYLRPGQSGKDCHAQAHITRMGNRFANVQVEAWQDDRVAPIALARMNLQVATR